MVARQKWKIIPGGALLIKSDDPVNKIVKQSVLIKNGNAAGIIYHQDQVYFIEGLLHMTTSEGALYRLNSYKDSVRVELIEAFNSAPMLLSNFSNRMYLVTADRLYTIENEKSTLHFSNLFWNILYPNSILITSDDELYIGMRGGYSKIKLRNKQIEFYKLKSIKLE